jgi:hypothetical protein
MKGKIFITSYKILGQIMKFIDFGGVLQKVEKIELAMLKAWI